MWTIAWQPSTTTLAPTAWAAAAISLMGVTVPSTLDMWVMATIFVRGPSSALKASRSKEPSSRTGAHLMTAPLRSRRKCHGTMLEWCSMMESTISSPAPMDWPRDEATVLMAPVPERVKMISSMLSAFRNARAVSRACSNASVAALAR